MLTRCDMAGGPRAYVVGVRPDGSRLVIETFRTAARAVRRAKTFRRLLEGYAEIRVEREGLTYPGEDAR